MDKTVASNYVYPTWGAAEIEASVKLSFFWPGAAEASTRRDVARLMEWAFNAGRATKP